ncbi:MAG: 50S ribosomal protein L22 [Desulfomonilia bacterium]|jgi:large subunit ribosomal protein L22|uniref:50S ribosomal subunit protein L22 n=1 Tax=anaerobic digester metagenome TaxID=1263854 RepID=A0A485M1X7_9ZZZZ|nr:50S ribosomal protein L22 [Pseudomonadota bacterium]HPD22315.1 50S ribosomal protein L22 [Deltaproteobacteria bacterium]HPX19326.1 50S ribosomal protein L22 [Deltaproteobacteria bacterium]HRS57244.1 50S ribosomal protein L22 [Desulfomonilia bacterium]HRV36699.1 50S ribosomal protein L22 [Desulfomonilia bacterium]
MESRAVLRHTRVSPQKTRLIADQVRNKPIADALRMLNLMGTKRARIIAKVLNSAVANAMNTGMMDVDNLYIKSIQVDGGTTLKRFRPRAQGRATRILKRTSHIAVVLDEL